MKDHGQHNQRCPPCPVRAPNARGEDEAENILGNLHRFPRSNGQSCQARMSSGGPVLRILATASIIIGGIGRLREHSCGSTELRQFSCSFSVKASATATQYLTSPMSSSFAIVRASAIAVDGSSSVSSRRNIACTAGGGKYASKIRSPQLPAPNGF